MKFMKHDLNSTSDITAYIPDSYAVTFEEPSYPAVIICPGGGFFSLSEREGEPVAFAFMNQGFRAFVLHYTIGENNKVIPNYLPIVMQEYEMAMDWILEHAEEWKIDKSKIFGLGFSAGAYVTAMYGNGWQEAINYGMSHKANEDYRLKAVILGYPMCDAKVICDQIKQEDYLEENKEIMLLANEVLFGTRNPNEKLIYNLNPANWIKTGVTPPTFLWHTADDDLLTVQNTYHYAERLAQEKIPHEMHVFQNGVHGLSLGMPFTAAREEEINKHCEDWFEQMLKWLKINF